MEDSIIRSKNHLILLVFLALVVLTSSTYAEVPNVINYQGWLTDSAGIAYRDSEVILSFTIYITIVSPTRGK